MEMIPEEILTLVVPAESGLRDEIRQKTESYFEANAVSPPVSYKRLAELADKLISAHDWDIKNKAYVMICCGNAIWRPVVGAIPFDRRMLLLPQCLKNSNLCKAEEDEFGLLCNECGNCSIAGIVHEAENLGYITIVAEGTTIATRLVESGQVDAIIGVGCMEVLQKIFRTVYKYSVPSIGVPLLSCGCIDTTADADWIRKEMNFRSGNPGFHLINLHKLKDTTAKLFVPEKINALLDLDNSQTHEILKEIILAGGKRIRPVLTALAYHAFSQNPDSRVLNNLAMSIECFHKASLVHDDIEDGDDFRYGKETVHEKHGIPIAINLGDMLVGEGYRLISECDLDPVLMKECFSIISGGHRQMASGQGKELLARGNNDILSMDEIIQVFRDKTAEAFRVALLTGSVAGGADRESVRILEEFSYLTGIAYQLMDDLEDIADTGDAYSLKNPSAVISMLAENIDLAETDIIKRAVEEGNTFRLLELARKYSVRELIERMILDYLGKIEISLSGLKNIPLKLALHEIIGKTFSKYL